MKVLISAWSRPLRNGNKNPKNYPQWKELVKMLKDKGIEVTQIKVKGEEEIGADKVLTNLRLGEIQKEIDKYDIIISVDNFFPHFCNFYNKKCIVIFGQSNPDIFGYKNNVNLIKDRRYLRSNQFDIWENEVYKEECFVDPEIVMQALESSTQN